MPTLFPSPLPAPIRRDPRKASEVQVYDALAAQLGDGWCVFHSVAWLGKGKDGAARDGEADFVIAHPTHGVLVLEVKGGEEIRFEGSTGQWYSCDVRGDWHKIRDPFEQARRNKHALLAKLRELPAMQGRYVPMVHAVCFPGVQAGLLALRPDAPREIVIDRPDLGDLRPRLEAIFAYARGEHAPVGLDASGMAALTGLLARDATLRLPLVIAAREEERAIVQLTEAQFGLLDFLARQRRAAIHGGAGTGKTVLAYEKARRLAGEGFRTLLTCFNVPLETHLRAADAVPGLTIRRFHGLCVDAARATGVPVEEHPPDHPDGDYWTRVLPEALHAATERGLEKFDAIVVDEAQDFPDAYWLPLQYCLAEPETDILYVFLDTAQRIYHAESSLIADLPRFDLPDNVRNTQAIHAMSLRFAQGTPPRCNGPAGRPPEVIALPDGQSPAKALPGIVQRLLQQEQFPPEHIAILTGRKLANLGLSHDQQLAGRRLTSADAPRPGHLTLDTIHRFKGLDAPVVILTGLDGLYADTAASLLYVGITRARSHLIVVERPEVLARWGFSGT